MLQHVTLEIRPDQVDDCVAFWALLGFERMEPPPLLRDRFVWVTRNGTQIHLLPRPDPRTTDQGHAAVLVEDYPATVNALEAAGHETRPGSNAWDAPRAFVRDPSGNLVELMSAPPFPPWPADTAG